ncbi:hypothetical protein J2Z62_000104 [Mycoplasmoides fastidiosum]|uniref:Uncharacterized protein n=1 Tax=Mycoplasmoides fastidiosum TaxID=92758 RepID=A0ABU0LY76_9BACT|nr:DUF5385 family protein [Mycoplasmoides fastidiosum]MDQ0513666.1 hypothetical protein [Mycoplasmoides fastidiosum]UUD37915.1 DUF5385 family protein [Mycoplasmoides fastidiosum]
MNQIIIIVVIVAAVLIFFFVKKGKGNKSKDLNSSNTGQGEKRDEVWRTIKEFLKQKEQKGLEVVSTYSIQRPRQRDLHKRLKQALIFDAKQKAKQTKTKYQAPVIPEKFELEAYFENLAIETFEKSKFQREEFSTSSENEKLEPILFNKSHRPVVVKNQTKKTKASSVKLLVQKISNKVFKKETDPNDPFNSTRERYVLIFRTRNPRTRELLEPQAIEVEILKNAIDKRNTSRKIIINKELDMEKEMAWIKPIKHLDDNKALEEQKRAEKAAQKHAIYLEKKRNEQLWYQKGPAKVIIKKFEALKIKMGSKVKK